MDVDTMSDAPPYSEEMEAEAQEQKVINEEYKIWKKNSMFLYDLMYGRALEWPTLTTQWFPDKKPVEGTNMSAHRLLLGTHTSNQAQNYIQIAQVEVPDFRVPDVSELDEQRGEAGGYGNAKKPFDFKVIQKINHPGEVNKARYQPQNPDIIASLCVDGRVLIFDRTKHPMTPKADGTIKTEAELIGHEKEGFGLSWSPLLEGHIATGNEDTTVRTWDLKAGFSKTNSSVTATTVYTHHTATVNDVQYHPIHSFLIGSVSDDLTWQIIDTRAPTHSKALYRKEAAHADAVNCIAFHPQMEVTMATGSADKTVALWDLRNFDNKIHSLESHKDAVMNLQWHPQDSAILASSSYDRRICMWDLSKIGEEQSFEEQEDGPPELLFMHGGFTNRICDFDWNKNDPWVMLAAAEDNQMQIFRPARKLVEPIKKNPNLDQEKHCWGWEVTDSEKDWKDKEAEVVIAEPLSRERRNSNKGVRTDATAPVKEFLVEQEVDSGVPENGMDKDRGVTDNGEEVSGSVGVEPEPVIATTESKKAVDEKKRKRDEPDDARPEATKADAARPTPKRPTRSASRTSPPPEISPKHYRKASRELQGLDYGFPWAKK